MDETLGERAANEFQALRMTFVSYTKTFHSRHCGGRRISKTQHDDARSCGKRTLQFIGRDVWVKSMAFRRPRVEGPSQGVCIIPRSPLARRQPIFVVYTTECSARKNLGGATNHSNSQGLPKPRRCPDHAYADQIVPLIRNQGTIFRNRMSNVGRNN